MHMQIFERTSSFPLDFPSSFSTELYAVSLASPCRAPRRPGDGDDAAEDCAVLLGATLVDGRGTGESRERGSKRAEDAGEDILNPRERNQGVRG
jgi:hypothetical protein